MSGHSRPQELETLPFHAHSVADIGAIQLARMGAAVGLDVPARTHPGGSPLRDAAQLRLLARFRATIGDAWTWRSEVPVAAGPDDRRAIDAVLLNGPRRVGIEALTRLTDAQGQVRAILLKQEAAALSCMLLVLADTRHNRHMLRDADPTLRPSFPVRVAGSWVTFVAAGCRQQTESSWCEAADEQRQPNWPYDRLTRRTVEISVPPVVRPI